MGELLIKPYEISVWEDRLTQIEGSEPAEYKFEEQKLAVIGSNNMEGPSKIYEPIFNKKSNGEKSLTFSLKYKYFDPYSGNEEVINPFAALLSNERKIKLNYDGQWYEFIIKEHSESTEDYTWTYTCTDAFVLELSKNGYNITFDAELNNNQGTAYELVKETLKDTDWKVGDIAVGKQLIEEPLYRATLLSTSGIEIINASNNGEIIPTAPTDIYLFYSYVKNQNGKFIQFIIRDDTRDYVIDDKNVINDTNFRILTNLTFKDNYFENEEGTKIISIGSIENVFQGYRLAYKQLTTYDPITEHTVDKFKIYKDNEPTDLEVYKYIDYTYTTSNVIMNFFTNGENFNALEDGSLQGWNPYVDFTAASDNDKIDKLELITRPELGTGKGLVNINTLSQIEGFLKAKFKGPLTNYKNAIYNSGIENNAATVKSISQGEKFLFRWRAGTGSLSNLVPTNKLRVLVAKYTQDTPNPYSYYYKHIDSDNIILQFEGTPQVFNNIIKDGYLEDKYELTTDTEIVAGKTYYIKNDSEIEEYIIVVNPTVDNISTYYEIKHNYLIDNVVQTPSTKYIYKDKNTTKNYIWNGLDGNFEEYIEGTTNFLPYYYLVASAQKSITNTELLDPGQEKNIGIFVYTIDSNEKEYYIQDIQLTRYIEDANEDPILIGNIPTATSTPTEYYYFKPLDKITADEVETYTTVEELLANFEGNYSLVPIYNEESEKILSISETHSNCFNILQSIAETFECWVDLVVEHDEKGQIVYDSNGIPQKFVYLREYAGKDNYSGFKYGVNLQSIERTVNSDEIVTKLIVEQTQSEYVEDGVISIANSSSNPSGESYIYNFNYYYNQGMLDREATEAEVNSFFEQVKEINLQLKTKQKESIDLEASLTRLKSDRNVYTELIDTAEDNKTQALADFWDLTGQTYEEYRKIHTTLNDDDQLTEEETILDTLGELYTNSAVINNYSGLLTNIDTEYKYIREKLKGSENYKLKIWVETDSLKQRHIIIELNDFLENVGFTIGSYTEYSTVSRKRFDVESFDAQEITFTAPTNYYFKTADNSKPTTLNYQINDNKIGKLQIICDDTKIGIEDEIQDLLDDKTEIVNNFNNKYYRFIQEGTWSSTEYIDSELYYLDALQVSNTSAYPTVSYTIEVVEISQLEGFEWYKFDTGDKSYIEDTEFFGWSNKNGNLTPAREEVIVSEVEWHLDEPDKNTITVQNYKTRFEDLFQRISATIQTVQYNEATYAKISSLLDANGTINQNVLLESLNNISGKSYNLTSDGSVLIDGDQISIRNLTNPTNLVKINSEGIRISSDGGVNWTTAISGRGIDAGAVYTGSLNTNQIVIGSDKNPSFRWDKSGISAYKLNNGDSTYVRCGEHEIFIQPATTYYTYNTQTNTFEEVLNPTGSPFEQNYYRLENPYNLKTFVRYDQYGLYGIKNNEYFIAQSLQDIKDKAHFAVTWDGFFIKNSYEGGGRVEITSDNDFRVLNTINQQEQEKIKIGALEWTDSQGNIYTDPANLPEGIGGPSLYGIRIKNDSGAEVMKTDDEGNITITGTINASAGEIGGMTVNNNWLRMNYIVLEPGGGIYSTYPNVKGEQPVNPSISTYPFWISDTDGSAIFNNVTVRGSIKTSVFEYEEIQAIGGAFIFRPSTTIRTVKLATDAIYDETTNTYSGDLIVTVEKPLLLKNEAWYKISNYNSSDSITPEDLTTFGLTHIYQLTKTKVEINTDNEHDEIRLLGAAAILDVIDINDIPGGSLIDMGYESNHINYNNGRNNYGIGINSSDNYINLPPRAISLFETIVNHNQNPKVSYKYTGIFGTLPNRNINNIQANSLYDAYMEGTQGIYTDNMYIGDDEQFIAFYEEDGKKQLKIKANQVVYEVVDDEGQPTGQWNDINQIEAEGVPGPAGQDGEDAIYTIIDSSAGNVFINGVVSTILRCYVYKGGIDITNDNNYRKTYTWTKINIDDGSIIQDWTPTSVPLEPNAIRISTSDVTHKAVFQCSVDVEEV